MKRGIQIAIIILGVASSIYGISKLSTETATMILPGWLIVAAISLIVFMASIGIGILAKRMMKSNWYLLTFVSIIITILVGIYSVIEYKPTLRVFILPDYSGEVKLFVSKDGLEAIDIKVNQFGIGYITKKDFDNGFYPKIMKGQNDISKDVNEYSKGAVLNDLSNIYSFKYLSFFVPGTSKDSIFNINDLLKVGAVDTTRLAFK